MLQIMTRLAGVLVNGAQKNLKEIDHCKKHFWKHNRQPVLVREPSNPYDPNAIRVEADGEYLGYIPQGIAKDLALRMDKGSEFVITHSWFNKSPRHEVIGMTVTIDEVFHSTKVGEIQEVRDFA